MKFLRQAVWRDVPTRIVATSFIALVLTAGATGQQQSPMLDDLVSTGELPPVAERLPESPLVVKPVESVGTYGGTWRSALFGGNDTGWIARTVAYDGLVRYDREWNEVLPNLAESWSVNEDATVYTFTLRSGVKWSDGRPFTTEDIAFAINLLSNPAYPAPTGFWKDPENPVAVEVENETTFRLAFAKPNGLLIDQLASVDGYNVVSFPSHYCGQFHPDFNANVESLVAEAGAVDWLELMSAKCAWGFDIARWSSTDLPTMNAWVISEPISGSATRVVFERNPFYWKVDTEGNQLPYIDFLEMKSSSSIEEITLSALNGEIDFQDRHIATVANQPLFYENLSSGEYIIGTEIPSYSNRLAIALNFNHSDPVKRKLFNDINFRIGLSHAIDRQEIIDVLFAGQGYPAQVAPRPESPFYDEQMTTQYTEFDPDRSAEYMQNAGLVEKNSDGYYLMEDGNPLTIYIDVFTAQPSWIDILEIMQLQLANSGINLQINAIDRSLMYEKRPGNDFDAQAVSADGGIDVIQEPRHYFPANAESVWAYRWQAWYNNTMPEIAEEPAAWAKMQMELYSELRQTATAEGRADLMKEILKISKENFPVIGIAMPGDGYYIATPGLKNVSGSLKQGWWFPTPAPYDPFQWYFAQ